MFAVMGVTGQVGGAVAKKLLADGAKVAEGTLILRSLFSSSAARVIGAQFNIHRLGPSYFAKVDTVPSGVNLRIL